MAAKPKDVEAIYNAALKKSSETERSKYLDSVCGDDAVLRARVEELLKAHKEAGSFLEVPVIDADVTLDSSPISEGPGTVIGRYKLLEQVGEGGFGVVYMAEQTEPIHRKVALKIIKLGMDTKSVIARFEAERQALAMMDHPNIAKVFDAGATDTGRPYFVMELVKGIPITEYCDKNNLDTKQRLRLFVDICKALQHAHQKGIVHRDIKPSNVLITLHDGEPVPKVIDFGIAKATAQRLTEKTVFTRFAQMIGTPEYMSPEQAEFSGLDVDARSDIYSLGVLLYQLLTGVTPFDAKKLREAGYGEMQRIIREDEPDKPSTRLSAMGEVLADIAKHRKVSPDILAKLMRGDLDLIIMKTLEKDRTRRYERAVELAADVERHLNNKPVLAAPPSMTYRLKKFVRRNRVAVITFCLVAGALAIGTIATTLTFLSSERLTGRIDQAEFTRAVREHLEQLEGVPRAKLVWAYPTLMDVAALSPDGHYLAFRDQDTGDLSIRDLRTGENRRLTHNKVPFEATTEQARFSPDGEWIAYNWYYLKEGRQEPDLQIVRTDGSGLRTVYTPNGDVRRISPYAWFPGGNQILGRLLRDGRRRQAVVVSLADSSVRVIEGPDREFEHLSLSPDGRYIAYNFYPGQRSGPEDIAVLPVDGGPEIRVIEHPADDDLLGWAPDGRMLVFRSDRGGEGDDAWVIQIIDGKPQGLPQLVRKRIDKEGVVEYGQFTRDGSFYFPVQKSRLRQPVMGPATDILIATLDPKTGKVSTAPKPLTQRSRQRVISPAFSPDGKYVAYYIVPPFRVFSPGVRQFVGSGQVFIRSLATDQEREIALSPRLTGGLPHLQWFPDGRSFLIGGSDETGRSGIYRADTHTGKLTPLVLDDPRTTGDWQISGRVDSEGDEVALGQMSPDGKTLYYLREHFDPNAPNSRPRQTGDYTQARILARDLETGREREVYRNPEGVAGGLGFTVSPDGRWVALRAPWVTSNMLKVVPAAGGEPRELLQLQEPEHIRGVEWTSDGRYLLCLLAKMRTPPLQNNFSLWRISAEGGAPEQVHEFDQRQAGPRPIFTPRVHPDGNLIAFVGSVGLMGTPQMHPRPQDQELQDQELQDPELWVLENFLPELTSRPVQLPNPPAGNYFITRSGDDAEERPNGVTDLDDSDLDLGQISGVGEEVSCAGIRFEGIRVPRGAEIKKAFLQFTKNGPDSEAEPSELTIHAELSANAAPFMEADHNISSRKRTRASVKWSPEGWTIVGERAEKQRTPDLSSLIQEVVDQRDWLEGNALVLIITGSGERDVMSFDGGRRTYAPMLHIDH